jgi:hypothetical protein
MAKYYTNKISTAAYLMGPHRIKLITAHKDQNDIFKIVLDISPEQADRILNDWPTSEARVFDACVKLLKDRLCKKPRKFNRRAGGMHGETEPRS